MKKRNLEPAIKNKCVMILSDKSSGSSILQKELLKIDAIRIIKYTRHFEQETLFWNKAVAVLGLLQEPLKYSELPMSREFAKADLYEFLRKNIPGWSYTEFDKELIFQAWQELCLRYGPVFLEKSPHHLHYAEALKLIVEMIRWSEIEFYFIGLIRNPIDTLYSSWQRWSADPENNQYEWQRAYTNLLSFKDAVPERTIIIRYEELMSDRKAILRICEFLGIDGEGSGVGTGFHAKSIQRWRKDRFFAFDLSENTRTLAHAFGYKDDEMTNTNASPRLWSIYMPVYDLYLRALRAKRRLQSWMAHP
jgi:Sulfotransferase family